MSSGKNDPVENGTKDQRSLPERTISVDEAARSCGVSTYTVRRWISQGKVKAYRVGPRFIRVDLDDLEALFTPLGPGENL